MYVVTLILVKIYFDVIFLSFFFSNLTCRYLRNSGETGCDLGLSGDPVYTLYLIKRFFWLEVDLSHTIRSHKCTVN